MAASAGKNYRLLAGGSPVAFGPESMTLVSGKTYKITDSDKDIWRSPERPVVWNDFGTKTWNDFPFETWKNQYPWLKIYDNGTTFSDRVDPANIESIDYLNGRITFVSGYTPAGTIYAEGEYIPVTQCASIATVELNKSINLTETTTFKNAKDDNDATLKESVRKTKGLRTANGTLGGFYNPSDNFDSIYVNAMFLYLRLYPDLVNLPNWRYTVKALIDTNDNAFDVNTANEYSVAFQSHEPVRVVTS